MEVEVRSVQGQISVDEFGNISVRTDTIIERDGVEISRSYHRETIQPGADVSEKGAVVAALAEAAWTPEVAAKAALRMAAKA